MTTQSVSRNTVKALAKRAFPDYAGRKFRVVVQPVYAMADYWDGGSRYFAVAVDLATGRIAESIAAAQNPFKPLSHACVAIPTGAAILQRAVICGHDAGVTLYVAPPAALPEVR